MILLAFSLQAVAGTAAAFTINLNSDQAVVGTKAQSGSCQLAGEEAFTSDAGQTYYSSTQSYSGNNSLQMEIRQGQQGFGAFGGIINFNNCGHVGGRNLVKGEEIWIRMRMYIPSGFQWNRNGKNKFIRFRTYHNDSQGRPVSEGYNDLYLDSHDMWAPFKYIFEGAQQWYNMGQPNDWLQQGRWETVEFYLKLDNVKGSQGGNSMVRVWKNGNLIGETNARNTLKQSNSYVGALYLFTYWDNSGSHITQKLYVDDLVITTNTPSGRDANGNPYIGIGVFPPVAPTSSVQ